MSPEEDARAYGHDLGDEWEDPQYEHDHCTGCPMCATWEGRTYEDIRAERRAYVARVRAEGAERPDPSPARTP